MDPDLRIIAPLALGSLSPQQVAAFNASCLALVDSALKWLGTDAKTPSERLCGEIGYEQMVPDVRDALESCARGLTSAPASHLIDAVKRAVSDAQRLKADRGEWDKKNWSHLAASTEHIYFHIPLQIALSCLESIRLNPFETMTSVLAALRTGAIHRCDTDPIGAVNIEIRDTMIEAVPQVRRAYLYVAELGRTGNNQAPLFFPRGFLNEIETFQSGEVADTELIGVGDSEQEAKELRGCVDLRSSKRDPTKDGVSNTFEYQVFISFKNLDSNGQPTEDSVLAEELYGFLTSRGLRVFFSNLSLEKLGQSAYSKAIDDALEWSQILIAVTTSHQHLESDWVRYEWDSFYNDIISQIKPNGRIFSYVKGIEVRQLPRKRRQQQVFHHERNQRDKLYNFIDNALI